MLPRLWKINGDWPEIALNKMEFTEVVKYVQNIFFLITKARSGGKFIGHTNNAL